MKPATVSNAASMNEPSPNNVRKWQQKVTSKRVIKGSGCGSVGRVVASDTRGPQIESSHRQIFIKIIYLRIVNCVEKTKINKKRPRMAHVF